MKVFRDESGQMLVFTALTMTALLGFLALSTDVGSLFRAKRQLQIAADAAATAGAMDILYGNANYKADATSAAAANGATTASGAVVTVNSKPLSGYHQADGYVEVLITQPNPTFFMKVFGISSMNISARAVAGSPGYVINCQYYDDPTGYDFKAQGSFTMHSSGCGVYVNSLNTRSILSASGAGGALTIIAPWITTVGGGPTSLGGAPIYAHAAPESAPNLQSTGIVPSASTCTMTNPTPVSGTIDGADGVVCFTGNNYDITGLALKNGVFVFENGVQAGDTGGSTNVTNGTIEVYGGAFNQNSNSNLNITAPASRTETFGGLSFNGVALLVPAANLTYNSTPCQSAQPGNGAANGALQVQWGSNNQTIDGYIVAPDADIYLQDNGGGTTYSGIYAACLFAKSSTININNYNAEHPLTTPLATVALVE